MSVEIRRRSDDRGPLILECDWGVIEYPRAHPDRGEVGPLVLVAAAGVDDLMKNGVNMRDAPALASASLHKKPNEEPRMFYHLDYRGQRWTWELFKAHWWDRELPKIYIGRWPD